MSIQDKLFTAQDLENMPDDGKIYELHNGVLIEVAGSKYRQSRLAAWIIYLLTVYIEQKQLGGAVTGADGTFVLSAFNTRIPDVAYISPESARLQDGNSFLRGAPDLAVEVVSPSNTPQDMQQRAGEYLSVGSRLIWIVNAERRTIDVYQPNGTRTVLGNDQILDGGTVLPGLALKIQDIFGVLDRQS